MNPRSMSCALLAALALAGAACAPTHGKISSPYNQIDEGSFVITDVNGATVGGAYAYITDDKNNMVEFWVRSASWPKQPPITLGQGNDKGCANWWNNTACTLATAGVYFTTTVPLSTQAPCPPPAKPPGSRSAFLWPGDYQISLGSSYFAWIYVDDSGEYWSMVNKVPNTGKNALSTATFTTYDDFGAYACKASNPPTLWFAPAYSVGTASCGSPPQACGSS
jgi:hypothetical protein